MSPVSIWNTMRLASKDVCAAKSRAALIWSVGLAASLLAAAPGLFGAKYAWLTILLQVATIIVTGWVWARWAAVVIEHVGGATAAGNHAWPTAQALVKYYLLLLLALTAAGMLMLFASIFAKLSVAIATGLVLAGLVAMGATLWMAVRLSLMPALAAIGQGDTVRQAWQISRGMGWVLWRQAIVAFGLMALVGSLILALSMAAAMMTMATHAGMIPPLTPASMHTGMRLWTQNPLFVRLLMAVEILMMPLSGWAYLTIIGAYVRLALSQTDASAAVSLAVNPWQS